MFFDQSTGLMKVREFCTLGVQNPVIEDFSKPILEGLVADLQIKEVRAIYPLIRALNSGRLTRNMTFYPAESLAGKNNKAKPTGYSSFVYPFGKPIITEHRLQDDMFTRGDTPMGRCIAASFVRRKKDEESNPPRKGYPGTLEGDGSLMTLPAITDQQSIIKILGRTYQTVSVGSNVENVWESISGKNVADLARKGEELPPYIRGQFYNNQLSYLRMGEITGREVSYVNAPSDEMAGTVDPDVGAEGIRLLVAEKKAGKTNEFNLFDAKTQEAVNWNYEESAIDTSYFVDSVSVGKNVWWLNKPRKDTNEDNTGIETYNESKEITKDSMVSWGAPITGKVISLHNESVPNDIPVRLVPTKEDPIVKIEVFKDGVGTGKFVAHKLSTLKLLVE